MRKDKIEVKEAEREQKDVVTVQIDYDVDLEELLEAPKDKIDKLTIKMGLSSILGTRKNQQDSIFGQIDGDTAVAVVCDGMGGMNGGERASEEAIRVFVEDFYKMQPIYDIPEFMEAEAKKMDSAVYELRNEKGELLNGGSTVVAVIIKKNMMWWLSIGDSKIYIIRGDEIQAVNREHNYRLKLEKMLSNGEISQDEFMEKSKNAEALISYVGMGNVSLMDINVKPFELLENDMVLLCSDGLYKRLSETDIREIISYEEPDMNRAARRLTEVVMQRTVRTQDNTSIVLMQYNRY